GQKGPSGGSPGRQNPPPPTGGPARPPRARSNPHTPDANHRASGNDAPRPEFKLVALEANPAEVAQGHAPPGSEVLAYPEAQPGLPFVAYPSAAGQVAKVAVKRRVMVSGDQITRAKQGFDQQSNAPIVQITF